MNEIVKLKTICDHYPHYRNNIFVICDCKTEYKETGHTWTWEHRDQKTYSARETDTTTLSEITYGDVIEIKWFQFEYFIRSAEDGNMNIYGLLDYTSDNKVDSNMIRNNDIVNYNLNNVNISYNTDNNMNEFRNNPSININVDYNFNNMTSFNSKIYSIISSINK